MYLKKYTSFLLAALILICFSGCGQEKKDKKLYFVDSEGNPFAQYDGEIGLSDMSYFGFADIALKEAVSIIQRQKGLSETEAARFLKNNVYVETTLQKDVEEKANISFKNVIGSNSGFAITDLKGAVLAAGSSSETENYANYPTYAGSTIKPLSVYAPGMKKGILNWSSMQKDEPIKYIEETNSPWPTNADGKYSEKNISVSDAIANSTNTVAVKWLKEIGVRNSINFLEDNFGMDFSLEKEIIKETSQEEVLGNVALGYLKSGVTVQDMAGYYAVFANGGNYYEPYTISRIMTENGNVVYEHTDKSKTVISSETSYIMNKLLQRVVSPLGTGKDAYIEGGKIAGKTGTTDGNSDNWFVGVCPSYSCAVWHDNGASDTNRSPKVFKDIMTNFVDISAGEYPVCDSVNMEIYCGDSGKIIGENCELSEMGYFSKENTPEKCSSCK